MGDEEMRLKQGWCPVGCNGYKQPGAQTIVVRQVLGEREEQKVIDLHVRVPEKKPAIEHVIDVFVKNIEVNSVDVMMDHVIVRGEFDLKTIYVAGLPKNPVHALEMKHCKWTQDIMIAGARYGMDADASVCLEFVDFDVPEMTRAYKYKYHDDCDDEDTESDSSSDEYDYKSCKPHKHHKSHNPGYNPKCENPCEVPCSPPQPDPCDPCAEVKCFLREFDVSVILRVSAKVLVDREVQIGQGIVEEPVKEQPETPTTNNTIPTKPKG